MNFRHCSNPVTNLCLVIFLLGISGCDLGGAQREMISKARSQVQRLADELDKRTTETGVYKRIDTDDVKEVDPWGTRIQVSYSQGGVSEMVIVRSAGPDRQLQTVDDLVANGMAMNFKGVGEGIKKNTEETATKAAKGLVKGTIQGIKESVKESLPQKKGKESEDTKAKTDNDQ